MKNLAGDPQATVLCAAELQAANIPIVPVTRYGEVNSDAGGALGPFTFRRYWVYWVVNGEMSEEHAREINDTPRPEGCASRYSGGVGTMGDIIRVDGYSGGQQVTGPVDNWHIDTPEGLAFFAAKVREFGLDK